MSPLYLLRRDLQNQYGQECDSPVRLKSPLLTCLGIMVGFVKGNPEGHLNLVPVQAVATAMADIKGEGVYWLTNPSPPTIEQLTKWTGELIMVKLSAVPKFKPMPLESAFQRMTRAFQPYLEGDTFPSHITSESAEITKEMVKEAIRSIL